MNIWFDFFPYNRIQVTYDSRESISWNSIAKFGGRKCGLWILLLWRKYYTFLQLLFLFIVKECYSGGYWRRVPTHPHRWIPKADTGSQPHPVPFLLQWILNSYLQVETGSPQSQNKNKFYISFLHWIILGHEIPIWVCHVQASWFFTFWECSNHHKRGGYLRWWLTKWGKVCVCREGNSAPLLLQY